MESINSDIMNKAFVEEWLKAANNFNIESFLEKWDENAVLDDPSVGRIFKGHKGIKDYFESYFIGYKTQTRLVKIETISDDQIHIEVEFTGEFPEGKIGGEFYLSFKNGKIIKAKADLI